MKSPIDRRSFLRTAAALAGGAALDRLWGSAPSGKKMNFVLIVAEDMGLQLPAYGDSTIRTPGFDLLASRGVRFANAWTTQASCSPSRASVLTGLFPHQHGQIGLTHMGYRMSAAFPVLPDMLRANGYATGIVGKIDIAPDETLRTHAVAAVGALSSPYRDGIVTAAAKKFITTNRDTPFFIMVNYFDCHRAPDVFPDTNACGFTPVVPENVKLPPQFGGVEGNALRKDTAGYYEGVARLDSQVKELLTHIDETGIAGNTCILFISDHGPDLARGKTTSYDFGLRIPFFLVLPGRGAGGIQSESLVSTTDIMPTILDLAGIPFDAAHLPGQSLVKVADDPRLSLRDHAFGEWHAHGRRQFCPQRTVRDARYQLIHNLTDIPKPGSFNGKGVFLKALADAPGHHTAMRRAVALMDAPPAYELYDLSNDVAQTNNLAGSPAFTDVQQHLMECLDVWRKTTNDPYLNTAYTDQMRRFHTHAPQFGKAGPDSIDMKEFHYSDERR